ncbi:MAG: hypothetical protein H7326_07585 [Bdellovibrionaceae bacterium]|nr:hypothetical protein [Pseudobdellovibrionaceae bacterium]
MVEHKPESIVELLDLLPVSYLKNSVFMSESQSLQAADAQSPRAIIYGNGELVMSLNGSPRQRGFEAIEVMHYDRQKHEFQFQEITFRIDLAARATYLKEQNRADDDSMEWLELNNRGLREGKNPSLCLQCHGQNPRPIIPLFPNNRGMVGHGGNLTNIGWNVPRFKAGDWR